jgi:hypothetical protein
MKRNFRFFPRRSLRADLQNALLLAWLGALPAAVDAQDAATVQDTTTPAAAPANGAAASTETEQSDWLRSFPASQRRQLTPEHAVLVWPPLRLWRGELILLPAAGNAVHSQGPLLQLAEQLRERGWRIWLLARERPNPTRPPQAEQAPGQAPPLTDTELQAVLALVKKEPTPAGVDAVGEAPLPLFVLAQHDAASGIWPLVTGSAASIGGVVLLSATAVPDQAPAQPVLELHMAAEAREVPAAARERQRRWQHLPQYQQQVLLTSQRHPIPAWLANSIDGWLRKTALTAATAPTDNSLRRQMAAPTP